MSIYLCMKLPYTNHGFLVSQSRNKPKVKRSVSRARWSSGVSTHLHMCSCRGVWGGGRAGHCSAMIGEICRKIIRPDLHYLKCLRAPGTCQPKRGWPRRRLRQLSEAAPARTPTLARTVTSALMLSFGCVTSANPIRQGLRQASKRRRPQDLSCTLQGPRHQCFLVVAIININIFLLSVLLSSLQLSLLMLPLYYFIIVQKCDYPVLIDNTIGRETSN